VCLIFEYWGQFHSAHKYEWVDDDAVTIWSSIEKESRHHQYCCCLLLPPFGVTVGQRASQSYPVQPLNVNWKDVVWEICLTVTDASDWPFGARLQLSFPLFLDLSPHRPVALLQPN